VEYKSQPNFYHGRNLNPEPFSWQSSTLTTRLRYGYLYDIISALMNRLHGVGS